MAAAVDTDVAMTPSDAAPANGESREAANGSVRADQNATSQSLEGLEARFLQRCEVDLGLDDKTTEEALRLFKECEPLLRDHIGTIGSASVDETERLWNACVLFVLKRFSDGAVKADEDKIGKNSIVGVTLSQILKTTQMSLVEFFKEMPQFLAKTGRVWKTVYGVDWEKRLMVTEVQTDFYYLSVLFNYYKRVYQNLFTSADTCDTASGASLGTNGRAETPVHMQFGWMLFLAFRMHALSQFVDLVTYINGLLAVVIIMILHIPPPLRKFSLKDLSFFKERGADGRVQIVASICALYHDASEEDVSKMVQKVSSMIGELFKRNSSLRTRSQTEQLAGIDTEGLAYFEGLMDERYITSNLRILEKEYEEAYLSRGELDERMFISGDENVIGALSSGTPTSSGSKRKYDAISGLNQGATVSTGACPPLSLSPYSSPVKLSTVTNNRMPPPPTPVSVTMSTVKWLRTYICPLPAETSPELKYFFGSCDRDISADVAHRVQVLLKEIFSADGPSKSRDLRGFAFLSLDSTWVEQRQLEATKLYYRVLTAMCKAESQRLANKNLTALLTNERFHRCMIACSAELVLYTHKTVTMTFPAVLEPTGITAFDLSKVIESFVRHEETLPRELKRHLNSMEQQILESMAWEKGSSMYNALIVAKKYLAPVINRLGLLADPMPALDNLSQHSRLVSGSVETKPEHTEGSGVPASPQLVTTTSFNTVNGITPATKESGDQAGGLLSPKKELPSCSIFASPTRSHLHPPLQSAFASPQRPSPLGGGETCAETVISVFLQKVLKLAAVRIKDLCERLHLSSQVLEQVYGIMMHILYKETSLFFNRHIDQLILCSIYGICKVNKANVTFKKCIEHYGKQPQYKRHVFCNVFIDLPPLRGEGKASQETGDIVRFYNEVFVPATKQYLLHLQSAAVPAPSSGVQPRDEDKHDKDKNDQDKSDKDGAAVKPGSPKRHFPSLPDLSPKKVSASHNVYVSPLRTTKMDTIMSPHTRSLYACVGESTHAYQSPSKDLSVINNRLNNRRGRGRLDFSKASLVSDSLVTGSLYPCARSVIHHSAHLTSDSILINGQSQPSWTSVPPLPPSPLKCPRADS